MPSLKNRYVLSLAMLLLSVRSIFLCGNVNAQASQVSDYMFEYRTPLLIDADNGVMIVSGYGGNQDAPRLQSYPDGEILQTFPGRNYQFKKVNDGYVFWSRNNPQSVLYIYYYIDGEVVTLIEDAIENSALTYTPPVALPIEGVTDNWFASFTSQGLLLSDGIETIIREVDAEGGFRGWSSSEGRLFAYFDAGYVELDANNFAAISSFAPFPEGWVPLNDIAFQEFVLLSKKESGQEVEYKVANMLTGIATSIVDEVGVPANLPGRWLRDAAVDGEFAVLSLDMPRPYDRHFESPKNGIVRIHLPTSEGTHWTAVHTYHDSPFPIPLVKAEKGVVAFGDFELTGIEPYGFNDGNFFCLNDIHPGMARGIEIVPNTGELWRSLNDFSSLEKNGKVYFIANHPRHGREVWESDGSIEGTVMAFEFIPGPAGVEQFIFAPSTDDDIYAVIGSGREDMRLYKFDLPSQPLPVAQSDDFHWQRTFGFHDAQFVGAGNRAEMTPKLHAADDGSIASLYAGIYRNYAWIAFDHSTYLSEGREAPSGHLHSALHIVNDDGSLRALKLVSTRSEHVYMARNYSDGQMVLAVQHRPGTTFYDGQAFVRSIQGTFFMGLDTNGDLIWHTFIPGTQFRFGEIAMSKEGIFAVGFFNKELDLGPDIPKLQSISRLGFVAGFDLEGKPLWSAPLVTEQDLSFDTFFNPPYLIHYDTLSNSVVALEGGSSYRSNSSCPVTDHIIQIAAFNGLNGRPLWRHELAVNGLVRPTALSTLPNGHLWVSGYTEGDITWENGHHLEAAQNFMDCPWNGFHAIMHVSDGTPVRLFADEPQRAKFVYDTKPFKGGMVIASLSMDAEGFDHILSKYEAHFNIELDTRLPDGRLIHQVTIPTTIRRNNFAAQVAAYKVGVEVHPESGVYISAINLRQGQLGEDFATPSQKSNKSSFIIMRTEIPSIDFNALDEELTSKADNFLLYPNPASREHVFVQLISERSNEFNRAMLYDISGRLVHGEVLNQGVNPHSIHIPRHLRNGIYVLRLEGPDGTMSEKLVIDR